MAQTLQNQLLLCKSLNGIITLSDGAGSTISNGQIITNDLSGNTITTNTLNTTDTNITGTIDLKPTSTSITISNYNFATPSQTQYFYTQYSPPYSSITGWTISLISGTAPNIYIGNDFTALVNLYAYAYPEYPLFNQYISFQANYIYQMRFTQNLTFATTGNYILTFYIFGEYNRYSPTNNISVSCGNNSILNYTASEGAWKKVIMKFQITTAGSNSLIILVNNTDGTDSGISFSGIKIIKQSGLVVYDGTNTNNQLITTKGIYTNGFINNQGDLLNYGNFINYGPLNLIAPYSAGSLVIGSSLFGTTNSDTGRYNTLIGTQVVGSAGYSPVNLDSCLFIGYAAGEQLQNGSRNHGIGYRSHRWAQNSANDNVGYGYESNNGLCYQGKINCNGNVSIGNFVLTGGYSSNNNYNTTIGHASLSGADFFNSRSYNSICGANSLVSVVSNYNSSLGYNNANGITNTASDKNIFIGSNVCNTQSGSGNSLNNCSFIGSDSDVISSNNYSNSTCIGYNSRIEASNSIYLGTINETTYANGGLTIPNSKALNMNGGDIISSGNINLSNKGILLNTLSITSSGTGPYFWSFGTENHIIITGTIGSPRTITLPNPSVLNVGAELSISSQDGCVIAIRTIVSSGFTILDQNNVSQSGLINLGANVRYVALKCINITGNTWQITNVALPNTALVCDLTSNQTIGGTKTFSNSIVLSNGITAGSTSISNTALGYTANLSSDAQTQLNTINTTLTNVSYISGTNTTNIGGNTDINSLTTNTINSSGGVLDIGSSGTNSLNLGQSGTTTITTKGSLITNNGAQKRNGFQILSGTSNNLTKPLNEYYSLGSTTTGSLTLPVIDSDLYGSQVTFIKQSAINTWTINAGTGNFFRLYKSNSTATTTSISLVNNNTLLRIVATQSTIWDVILTDIFYDAASTWVVGTQYFPMLMNPTNITGAVNWNTSLPSAFYGQQGFSITATSNITLPQSTNVNLPNGLTIKFRRVGGTLATALQAVCSTGDTIFGNNALVASAAGTAVILVTSSAYWGELYLNKTTATWYCQ